MKLKKIIFSKKQYGTGELSEPNINYLLDTNFVNGSFVNNEDIELLKAIMYYSETSNCEPKAKNCPLILEENMKAGFQ